MPDLDPDEIINLERKLTRAMQHERGITLKPADLNVLAAVGALDRLSEVKSEKIKEKVKWRQVRASINAASSGLITTEAKEECRPATSSTSTGMIAQKDASAGRARASAMFRAP